MLLTDEEIDEVIDITGRLPDVGDTYHVWECVEYGAKAQLKKVVEWGDGYCQSGSHGGEVGNDMFPILKRECSECWQDLQKEVE